MTVTEQSRSVRPFPNYFPLQNIQTQVGPAWLESLNQRNSPGWNDNTRSPGKSKENLLDALRIWINFSVTDSWFLRQSLLISLGICCCRRLLLSQTWFYQQFTAKSTCLWENEGDGSDLRLCHNSSQSHNLAICRYLDDRVRITWSLADGSKAA